jgi:guanosine-3',5'-bis(diphosphate) 3'-pyrophosphohydrolase
MPIKDVFLESLRKNHGIDVETMIRDVLRYLPDLNRKKFREAFYFAAKAHDGQFRKENKPYIIHPVEAARILISMHADEDTLIATLLHDVPEDTPKTIAEIESKFGKKVAFLVEGITKLSKVHFRSDMVERQIESLKKFFIHSAEDPRIILIKLADRLHNMRTLQYLDKPAKQLRIAQETLEIFVPIANLLGIEELKAELEDLCFRFLHPNEYEALTERMQQNKLKHQEHLNATIELVQKKLEDAKIKAAVYGRQKNLFTIYKKTLAVGKNIDETDNIIALRILVPDRDECYQVLGILHSLFKPRLSRFKDYIAVPKVNGYQSLHTTVFGWRGLITEFQIRTHQMHLEAEYGIAAHYFYQQPKGNHLEKDRRSFWVEKILELQKSQLENNSFLEDLKLDILQDRIFVFTPKGDPIDLPKDASCIDFAYSIHTDVGNRALRADVNGEPVPMTTFLQTGDTVRIITSDKPKQPSREWLSFTKTNIAKNRIREYLQHESREARLRTGRKLLQKELDRAGLGLIKNISNKKIYAFTQRHAKAGYHHLHDVLLAIGDGNLSPLDFVNALYFNAPPPSNSRTNSSYTTVSVKITFDKDRPEPIRGVLRVISNLRVRIVKMEGAFSRFQPLFICKMILEVQNFEQLSQLFANIEQMVGVKKVERLFWKRKFVFISFSLATFLVWAAHPFLLSTSKALLISHPLATNIFLYASLCMLFYMVFSLKRLVQRSFPELRETRALWATTIILSLFVLVTFFAELFYFKLELNIFFALAFILVILSYLALEYIDYYDSIKERT